MDEKYRKIVALENTMKNIFQNLVDEIGDKIDLIDYFDVKFKVVVGDIYHHTHSFGQIGLVKPLS